MGQGDDSEGYPRTRLTAEEEGLMRGRRDVQRGTQKSGKCRIISSRGAELKTKGTVNGVRAERASNTGGGTFLPDRASARPVELLPTLLGFHSWLYLKKGFY